MVFPIATNGVIMQVVRFPNLDSDDVIIPGTANLSFNIELTSAVDANRTLVSNIGRAIIKKLAVKFEGNDMSVDDYDIFACYQDLWKTKSEKRNAIRPVGNRLCYEITFNDYNQVTKSRVSSPKVPDAKYKITDISLEYEIATQPDLVRSIRSKYQHMALLYDKILRHRKIIVNKSDTV